MKKVFMVTLLVASAVFTQGCALLQIANEISKIETKPEIELELEANTDINTESDQSDTKRVGNSEDGFVDIPSDWVNFKDVGVTAPITQFSNVIGTSIVTLSGMYNPEGDPVDSAAAAYMDIESQGAIDLEAGTTEFAGHEAFQVFGFYPEEDIALVMWFFRTEGGNINYVSVEGLSHEFMEAVERTEDSFALKE